MYINTSSNTMLKYEYTKLEDRILDYTVDVTDNKQPFSFWALVFCPPSDNSNQLQEALI